MGFIMGILTLLLLMSAHNSLAHTGAVTHTASTTQPAGTQLSINKLVDKTTAKIGDVLSYTLVISNVGSTTATNVVALDSSTTGLRFVSGSASVPAGSTFSSGAPISTWTVPSISAGQSFSLTFQAIADSSGILYTKATIPGDTATVCTSVPVKVCTGDTYLFRLTAAPGRSNYKWFKDGVELTTQTTNVLDVTATGAYSLAIDNVSGRCPDFSCCPFVVEEDTLPTFRATVLPVTCTNGVAQTNGRITLTNYSPAYTYQYSAGSDFNASVSLSGPAKAIPAGGVIATNLGNPGSAQPYTIRVINASGCYTDVTVTMQPTGCCSLSAVATAGACLSATNTYSATTVVTLTNSTTGILTVTNGPQSTTFATTAAPTASFTAVFANLTPDGASHTVTVSLPGCSTLTTTYSAPVSCSVAAVPTLALSVLPGLCQSATNAYTITGTLSLTNATAGTATVTDGNSTASLSVSAGTASVPYSITGLLSGTGSHTLTVSYASQSLSQTYTAPLSCSVAAPVAAPSLVLSLAPGICQPATNTYTVTGTLSLTNATAGTATLTDGTISTTLSVNAGATNVPYSLSGLVSGTGSHTVVVIYASQTLSQTYTAPVSCSVAATPTLGLSVLPGTCQSAANNYTVSGTLSLTNAIAGTATLTDGISTTSISVNAGATNVPYSLSGLVSGTGSHTLTVSYASQSLSQTYTAPLSCSVTSTPTIALSVLPGTCQSANNAYTVTGTLSLTNATAGTATVTDGSSTTIAISAEATSVPYSLSGLISGTGLHTVMITYAGQTLSQTYTAPLSCSVIPAPTLALSALPGNCQSATNEYIVTGILSLANATAGTATLTDGSSTTSISVNAGATLVPYSLTGLVSGTGSRTVTVTYASQSLSQTYTAPLSCTVAPVCSLSATVTAGICQSATNTYSSTVVVTIANPTTATLTVTNAGQTQRLTVTPATTSLTAVFADMVSDGSSHTVDVSLPGCTSMTTTYSAPISCSVATHIGLSVTDPGTCDPTTNTYTTTGVVSLTNATVGTATLTDGSSSTLIAINAGATSVPYSLSGLISGTGLHTVTVSYIGQTASTTYTAPVSCSIAPIPSLAVSIIPGNCQSATNAYAVTGTLSLTNAISGTVIITDGTSTTTVSINAGATLIPYSITGLVSGTGFHTLTVSYAGQTQSLTYTAPLSCSTAAIPMVGLSVVPGTCQSTTNYYTVTGTLSLTNAIADTATLTDGTTSTTLTVNAGATNVPYSLSGLVSGTGSHTVTVTYASQSLSQTYTAPLSCSVAPVCSLSATAVTSVCAQATNTFSASVVVSLINTQPGTLTVSLPGSTPYSQPITAATNSLTAIFEGLISDAGSHMATISLPGCATTTAIFAAPASCSVAVPATPVCSLSAVATAGACQSATNTYLATAVVTLTNSTTGILTVTNGPQSTTFATTIANSTSFTAVFANLMSDSLSHTVTVSLPGCSTATATYTAPASCSVIPAPTLALSVLPGTCQSTTNNYTVTGTLSLTNATAGTAMVTDGSSTTSVLVNAGATNVPYSLTRLVSGTGSHTVSITYAGQSVSTTYSAPVSCSVTPAPSLALSIIPGNCQPATNYYTVTGTLSLTNATAGTAILTDGITSTSISVSAGATNVPYSLSGLLSGTGSHTLTVSYASQSLSQTYTAPLSCSVAATPSLALSLAPGICQPATNTYTITGTLSLTNAVAGTATVSDGNSTATIAVSAGATSIPYSLTGLTSGTNTHTVTVSYASQTLSQTYTAPLSCSVAATPTLALSVLPGLCQSTTNEYIVTGTLSLTNATAGTATVSDGTNTTSISVNAGDIFLPYSLSGLVSGTGSRTVTVTYASQTLSQTYTAPLSCSVAAPVTPVCSVSAAAKAIPAICQDNVIQANGQIVLSAFNPAHTYQYSAGASFDPAASLSGPAKAIPADGVIANTLANPAANQPYTVRVYSTPLCYADVTVVLKPAVCACTAAVCAPFAIQQTKRAKRIGDAR